MTVQQSILEQLQSLSDEDQEKVLQYVQSLHLSDPDSDSGLLHFLTREGPALDLDDIEERWNRDWEHFPRDYPRSDGL